MEEHVSQRVVKKEKHKEQLTVNGGKVKDMKYSHKQLSCKHGENRDLGIDAIARDSDFLP